MPVLIRDAAPGDIPAIAAIYADEVRSRVNTYEIDAPDAAEMLRRMETLRGGGFPYFVAEREGAVVGYAYAGPFRTRAAYRWVVENSVYVAEGAQGAGIGAALLEALVAACSERGSRQMVAVIGEAANTASVRMHERAGFTHIGTFPGIAFKHGRWLDTVFMQRALGAGNTEPPHDG